MRHKKSRSAKLAALSSRVTLGRLSSLAFHATIRAGQSKHAGKFAGRAFFACPRELLHVSKPAWFAFVARFIVALKRAAGGVVPATWTHYAAVLAYGWLSVSFRAYRAC